MSREPAQHAAASALASFATGLRFDAIPGSALERAKQCLIDAVACAVFGRRFAWSRIALAAIDAQPNGAILPQARLSGDPSVRDTALAWGCLAHAFELDSLRKPGAGVHPGATVALPALAMALSRGASGPDLLRAIVAGCEVMFRIGAATLHTPETTGFHAPGLTGPFGSAVACGVLMGLHARTMTNAIGIAGSLGSGLLAFAKAGSGGMVKRLHLGRAAEGGVLAAQLAHGGYEGPDTVLDGPFGLLDAYCKASDPALLTAGLGESWEMETLCLKPFACHVTAQAPVQLLRSLMDAHGFAGGDIAALRLGVGEKVISHHAIASPADIMQAQYSVPFATAVAAFRDLSDPRSFSSEVLTDPAVCRLAEATRLVPRSGARQKGWGVDMRIRLQDGRELEHSLETFDGCPETPMSYERLYGKFRTLVADEEGAPDILYNALREVERCSDLRSLPRFGY